MLLLYHAYVYLEFLILACTIYILAPSLLGINNDGWSQYGPPTGKWLGKDGLPLYSICELEVRKVNGRWRVVEEWVVEGTEIKRQCLTV